MNKGITFKVEIRKDCLICGGSLPTPRFRTYCSKKCRDKNFNLKYASERAKWQIEYKNKKALLPSPLKIQCKDCSRWYVQIGTHVIQRHGYSSAREYKQAHGLDVKRGVVPNWYKEMKGEMVFDNGTVANLEAGAPYRFVPGDPRAGDYERSEQTMERLRNLKQTFKRKL
jgi:predicted nucleic acid-binding Zn ribbon protein